MRQGVQRIISSLGSSDAPQLVYSLGSVDAPRLGQMPYLDLPSTIKSPKFESPRLY